jgi:hypothetical protein
MLEDGILEISNSPLLNPLTVVQRDGKKTRICVNASKVNQYTVPDRERAPPLQELLQQFNGACYMTSLDLSSAYLQIELHKHSTKYTSFLFDSTVYQYKRVPYGFRNSLPAFVRALKLALGGGTAEYVVFYIDDILIYSKTFEEHLYHLDTDIFSKLLKKAADQLPVEDTLAEKLLKAYAQMKLNADKRNRNRKTGRTKWRPKVNDLVLVRRQPAADAAQSVSSKFQRPFEGPYTILKIINPGMYKLYNEEGKLRGLFNVKHLKPYLQITDGSLNRTPW